MEFHTKFRAFFPSFPTFFFQHFHFPKIQSFLPSIFPSSFPMRYNKLENIAQYVPLQELSTALSATLLKYLSLRPPSP